MASSGGTTGTPIAGGGGSGSVTSAERFPYTVLSLAEYAKIMGITPPHLWQAASPTIFPDTCGGVWYAHDWQKSDRVSREQLAYALLQAEEEIAEVIGYYPGPKWTSKEMHIYPRHHRRELYGNGRNIEGFYKSIALEYGKVIAAGQRAVELLGDSTSVAYSDEDGDGYNETATVTVTGITSTTNACDIKVYFQDKDGLQEWEIRPARTKTLSSGTFTATFDAWLLINPDLQEVYPNTDSPIEPIALLTGGNYVGNVDVYREYTDFTAASAEFSWEPKPYGSVDYLGYACATCGGSGCASCASITQEACFHIVDVETGLVVPTPATYDEDNSQWTATTWTECREPDMVKLWYYSGALSEKYLRGTSCNPLDTFFSQAIAWLATARLERNICGCSTLTALVEDLRRDMALSEPEGGFYATTEDLLNNPFGTKKGEVMAWKRIKNLAGRVPDLAIA